MKKQYDPLKVEKTDHPDLVGGVVWADCELDWIRAYGTRCYNHGNAKGMEAGRLLFEEPKVGAGDTAVQGDMLLTANTNGMVQFLDDCTHALAAQTLPLPELPPHLQDTTP